MPALRWLFHFQDADELPASLPALRLEVFSMPLERLGGGGVGSVARCHKAEERLDDWRPAGGSGGGVSGPLVRERPRFALGGMELDGEAVPQSGFDCPEVSGPLVRREAPMPDAPGEIPGSCPV